MNVRKDYRNLEGHEFFMKKELTGPALTFGGTYDQDGQDYVMLTNDPNSGTPVVFEKVPNERNVYYIKMTNSTLKHRNYFSIAPRGLVCLNEKGKAAVFYVEYLGGRGYINIWDYRLGDSSTIVDFVKDSDKEIQWLYHQYKAARKIDQQAIVSRRPRPDRELKPRTREFRTVKPYSGITVRSTIRLIEVE
ncbi:hypothetical protein ACH0CI_25530 [Priestia sp. 179-F W1.4 NHS]|uniref:hypothetical protein n=1 Tax=Priestia sp. 179-F W1.4 NHS TaxID=3374296 RepID=UPI0038798CDF